MVLAGAVVGLLIAGGAFRSPALSETYGSTAPAAPIVDEQGRTITPISWRVLPRPEFPEAAARQGVDEGAAVLLCQVTLTGELSECALVSETPSGVGFGQAALASVGTARLRPATIDGAPQPGRSRFTVRFRLQ